MDYDFVLSVGKNDSNVSPAFLVPGGVVDFEALVDHAGKEIVRKS